jgi:Fe-S cluster biogenesis protein NfuA
MTWESLSEDEKLSRIQEALSLHVRPFLANDGGGLELVHLQGNTVTIAYQGACAHCPAALTGTLSFIQQTLQKNVDASLIVVPQF